MKKLRTIIPLTTYKAPSQNDRQAADAHPIDVVDPIDDIADNNDKVFRGSTTHSVTAVNDKAVNEEELLEISKKVLGSYIAKASRDVMHHGYMSGTYDPMATNHPGVSMTRSGDYKFNKAAQASADASDMHDSKGVKRIKGIDKAVKKLTKPDTFASRNSMKEEQIDEVSVGKLDAYVNKAQATIGSLQGKKAGKRRNMMGLASIKGNLATGHNPSLKRSKSNPTGFVPGSMKEDKQNLQEISDMVKRAYVKRAEADAWDKEAEGNHLQYARGLSSDYKQHGMALRRKASQRGAIAHKVKKSLGESVSNPKSLPRLNRIDNVLNKSIDRDVDNAMKDHKDPDDAIKHADRNPSKRTKKLDNAWKSEFRSQRALHKEDKEGK